MEPDISRFGPTVRRYCLCIVYYLWEFSYPEEKRRKGIDRTTDASRRDLLGAVKPFIDEISLALDDPQCTGLERAMIEDFTATYEEVLDLVRAPFEKVDTNWDTYQLPHDTRLNRALFEVFRGLDLYDRGQLEDAAPHLEKGWGKLLEIETRRALPEPLRRLVERETDLLDRFGKDLHRQRHPDHSEARDLSGLPAVGHVLQERQLGRMQGLRNLEDAVKTTPEPPARPRNPGSIVISLEDKDATLAAALAAETVRQDPVSLPSPETTALHTPEKASPPSAPLGADGFPMEESHQQLPILSDPPRGTVSTPFDVPTLPPELEVADDDDDPWHEVGGVPDADSFDEDEEAFTATLSRDLAKKKQAGPLKGKTNSELRRALEAGPGPAAPSSLPKAPSQAKRHTELAELFDDD